MAELDADDNYDCELKKNGSRTVFWNTKDSAPKKFGDFVFWNRHKEPMSYVPSNELLDELRSLELPNNTHIDLELLHMKTKCTKNYLYLYDLYLLGGKLMTGTLEERRNRLQELLKGKQYQHLSIAERRPRGFKDWYEEATKNPINEGIVIKDKRGKIVWNAKVSPDVTWQIKCRVQHALS